MTGFTIAMFAMSIAGAAYSAYQQNKMAGEAKDIAKRNARIEEKRTERQIQMAERQQESQLGEARARMAASGLETEGTPGFYIAELESLGDEEITWIEREGEWKRQQIKLEGSQAASQLKAGAVSTIVGALGNIASFTAKYGAPAKSGNTSTAVQSNYNFDYGYDAYANNYGIR